MNTTRGRLYVERIKRIVNENALGTVSPKKQCLDTHTIFQNFWQKGPSPGVSTEV